MKRSSGPRKRADLSKSIHHRLNIYALAANAAGVGALAVALPAHAKIVYTPAHRVIGPNGTFKLDLNQDEVTDFILGNTTHCFTDFCQELVWASKPRRAVGGNSVIGYTYFGERFATALKKGRRIGPRGQFKAELVALAAAQSSQAWGPWIKHDNGYIGLRFQIHGTTHYGWARMSVRLNGNALLATLTGYAYETIPNKPIIAGKTHGPNVPAEPATLGRLASGRR